MDFKQYKGKNILAWLWFDPDYYNPDKGNTVCYVYPRVLVNKFHYELIDPADFPKHGSIRVNINGGDTAEDLYERFGSFVSLKINEDDPYPNYDGNNMYSLRYNSSFGRTNSGIWIEKFSGKDFYQIIDVDSDISTLINTRSIPEPDCTIRTTLVLLRLNSKLYGPFEYDTTEGTMKLRGIKDYQYNIGEYSAVDYNDELLVSYKNNFAYFKTQGKHTIKRTEVLVPYEKVKQVSRDSFNWILQNADQLAAVPYTSGIQFHGKNFLPYQVRTDASRKSWNVYENRVIIGFLNTALLNAKQVSAEFDRDVLNEERVISRIHGSFPKEYRAPIITIKSLQISFCRLLLKKLDCLIDTLQSVGKQYSSLFDVQPLVLNTLPRKTNTFCEIKPYAQVFEIIVRWFRYGEYSLEKERLILQVKTLDKLFEYYCLLRLLKLLADNGYQKANVKEPVFKFDYVSADEHYQNEKDVANTYLLSNGEVTATLYYQPVISAVQFENDLTLFRTTKPPAGNPDYYTPDFVLKFASSEDDEEYAIFDAKFSSRANIKKHSLPEVIRKYSCEISAASRSSAPKMVWVLQGRVNGSENAIWKYHNSQLASTYRPITSFGIVSINTAVEIRQRLWNEIRSSISLLQ